MEGRELCMTDGLVDACGLGDEDGLTDASWMTLIRLEGLGY